MSNNESLRNSLYFLITENTLYRNYLSNHSPCQGCIACSQNYEKFYNISSSFSINNNLRLLLEGKQPDHPEYSAFSTMVKGFHKCECGLDWKTMHSAIELSIPRLHEAEPIGSLLVRNKFFSKCKKEECKKTTKTNFKIEGQLSNFVISLVWESLDLDSLYYFLLGLEKRLDLSKVFSRAETETETVYLQGLIVSKESNFIYCQLDRDQVRLCSGYSTLLFSDYFIFALFQYSFFPVALVYNSIDNNSDLSVKINKYKEDLRDYIKFLFGSPVFKESLCFCCWNTIHNPPNTLPPAPWTCQCGNTNSITTLFCDTCNEPQLKTQTPQICNFCGFSSESIYCKNCSQLNKCFSCSKSILKTQKYACVKCRTLANSSACETCGQVANSIQCKSCFIRCSHNKGFECLVCFYDKTCGVCWRPLTVNKAKFCWKCRNKLTNGFCIKCKFYPPKNSLVCIACVNSGKKCNINHIITIQSISECSICKRDNSKFCEKCCSAEKTCQNREFCIECGTDLEGLKAEKILQETGKGLSESHPGLCYICYLRLPACLCGVEIDLNKKKCLSCNKGCLKKNKIIRPVPLPDNEFPCKVCDFPVSPSVLFCENCNSNVKSLFFNKKQCETCDIKKTDKYCKKCYIQETCSTCQKDLLITQRQYCKICNSKIYNRVCPTCKVIVPISHIICHICTIFTWACECKYLNSSVSENCGKCSRNREPSCKKCSQKMACFPSWRNTGHRVLANDEFFCEKCASDLPSCRCGSRYLPTESICRICESMV